MGALMVRVGFGEFELDPDSGELWKGGVCIRVPEQPLNLLLCLLEHPGQLVGREVLQKRVWAGDIHVGYEDGLNSAAWRLRQILGDTSEKRIFIETIPRKGYRFVGQVRPLPRRTESSSDSVPLPLIHPVSLSIPRAPPRGRQKHTRRTLWISGALALGLVAAGAGVWAIYQDGQVVVELGTLKNLTNDLALDYYARALQWQVSQDLSTIKGLKESPPPKALFLGLADRRGSRRTARMKVDWTLARDAQGYQIWVNLTSATAQPLGTQVFLANSEGLHEVHWQISDFVASQALKSFPEAPAGESLRR